MGADLYILSADIQKIKDKYSKELDELINKRNKIESDKEKKDIQAQIDEVYNKLYSNDYYYRDSYNNSNLLWQFNLDYWVWFAGLLKDGELTPEKSRYVLTELANRRGIFMEKIAKMSADERNYFKDKHRQFQNFLLNAIEANANIDCSI